HTRFSRDWSSDVCSSDLVQRMHDAATLEVVRHRLAETRIVVPVIEHPCPGKEVDVAIAVLVEHFGAARDIEHHRERADVAAYLRSEERREGQEGGCERCR